MDSDSDGAFGLTKGLSASSIGVTLGNRMSSGIDQMFISLSLGVTQSHRMTSDTNEAFGSTKVHLHGLP
jgi:hypothetical protein